MNFLNILQALVAIVIIVLILLQERSSGLSGIFGGTSEVAYSAKRGLEKLVFYLTAGLISIFIILALLNLLIK